MSCFFEEVCRFVPDFGQNWFDGTNFIEILFSVKEVGEIFCIRRMTMSSS